MLTLIVTTLADLAEFDSPEAHTETFLEAWLGNKKLMKARGEPNEADKVFGGELVASIFRKLRKIMEKATPIPRPELDPSEPGEMDQVD